jgi:dephospho-CoA kinase
MERILLTGMSGVGKSTVISLLAAQGYKAIDLDDPAWSEWVDSADGEGPSPLHPGKDWVWREDRLRDLLATEDVDVLFLSGCAPNLGKFREQFDSIVLLSAPAAVMVERLTDRETTPMARTRRKLPVACSSRKRSSRG